MTGVSTRKYPVSDMFEVLVYVAELDASVAVVINLIYFVGSLKVLISQFQEMLFLMCT